jgi:large subunit ribosomal protein L18e
VGKHTNPLLIETIRYLKRASRVNNVAIWARLAEDLEKSKHSQTAVNISRITRYLQDGEVAAIPGKVLGAGKAKKISVAAFSFSMKAKEKIEGAGGECLSLKTLVERNPKGSGVRIIG